MCELRQDHWLLWVTYKKLISLYIGVSWLLIVGLVWNFVCDFYGKWLAILCGMKAALESLESL